jgi:hypothetical protein
MTNRCNECKAELSAESKFCQNCGVQTGFRKDIYDDVTADRLVSKVKDIIQDAKVKRVIVKDNRGKMLVSFPVTWGTAGAIATVALAPWLAALGVIAGLVTRCTVEVEKIDDERQY